MKKYTILAALTGIILACCLTGCKEQLHTDPPLLEGDELIIATALHNHMSNHASRFGYDYQYIFITVLGEDPDRDFLDFFSALFPAVMPGSRMKESRYGYENLPQTKGVWIHFEAIEFDPVSDQEAWVTCQSYGYQMENPGVKYRMQFVDGQWKATSIMNVDSSRILQ